MIAHNLPAQPTPFFSRSAELTEIASLLADSACRLLTLVGPGGIGKTRLALEAANAVVRADDAHFPQGVYFVSLQPLGAADLIVPAITTMLNIPLDQSSDDKHQLLDALREKALLLVLDNFEHLLDGAELLSEILTAAPGVRLLVTSRERLNLREEWAMEVNGLSFPIYEDQQDIERYSAVQFFLQNAQRVQVGFQLTDDQKPAIIRICRLVSGIPLAIELAAAWVRVMSCEQITAEIERSLDVLETPARNVPPRHRNMRAVFEPTWVRLSGGEQDVFMRLSVFRGGFTREAAQAVAGATLPMLSALADKSLIKVNTSGRYDVHELLRQYGEEHLVRCDSEKQTGDAHSAYYAEFLHQREADVKGRRQLAALNEIEADFDNIRAAWYWLVEHKNYPLIDASLEGLFLFCEMRSQFHEGAELFRQACVKLSHEAGEETRLVFGRLLVRSVAGWSNDTALKRERREKALQIAQTSGNQAEIGYCLWRLGELAEDMEDWSAAIAFLEPSLAHLRQAGDRYYEAKVLNEFGFPYRGMNQPEKAIVFQQESLNLRREMGDERGMGWCLYDIGRSLRLMGRYGEAQTYFQEANERWHTLNDLFAIMCLTGDLGYLAFARGDFDTARTLSQEVFDLTKLLNQVAHKATPLTILGIIASLEEDDAEAKRLCEQSLELEEQFSDISFQRCGMAVTLCSLQDFQAAQQQITAVFRSARVVTHMDGFPVSAVILAHDGQKELAVEVLAFISGFSADVFGWTQKWSLFTRLQPALEAKLPPETFEAAWERGKTAELNRVIASVLAAFEGESLPSTIHTANQSLIEPLSERELEVLNAIAAGSSNSEIAAQMVVEVSTIKKHLTHIYDKLGVTSRTQAIAHARELRLL